MLTNFSLSPYICPDHLWTCLGAVCVRAGDVNGRYIYTCTRTSSFNSTRKKGIRLLAWSVPEWRGLYRSYKLRQILAYNYSTISSPLTPNFRSSMLLSLSLSRPPLLPAYHTLLSRLDRVHHYYCYYWAPGWLVRGELPGHHEQRRYKWAGSHLNLRRY